MQIPSVTLDDRCALCALSLGVAVPHPAIPTVKQPNRGAAAIACSAYCRAWALVAKSGRRRLKRVPYEHAAHNACGVHARSGVPPCVFALGAGHDAFPRCQECSGLDFYWGGASVSAASKALGTL